MHSNVFLIFNPFVDELAPAYNKLLISNLSLYRVKDKQLIMQIKMSLTRNFMNGSTLYLDCSLDQ